MSDTSADTRFKLSESWLARIQDGTLAIIGSNGRGISTDDLIRITSVLDVLAEPRPLEEMMHKVSLCIDDDARPLVDAFLEAHILVSDRAVEENNSSVLTSPVAALMAELDSALIDGELFTQNNSKQKMAVGILAAAALLAQRRKAFDIHRETCVKTFLVRAEEGPRPLRINIGAGQSRVPGWLTVDISPDAEVAFDVTLPWPLPDRCVETLYVSHILEHFELETAVQVLTQARRVLTDTGMIRVVVPDARAWLRAYVQNDDAFFRAVHETWTEWPQGVNTLDLVMGYLGGGAGAVRPFAHRAAYDFEKLKSMLTTIGFSSIRQSKFTAVPCDEAGCIDFSISLARQSSEPDRYALFVDASK